MTSYLGVMEREGVRAVAFILRALTLLDHNSTLMLSTSLEAPSQNAAPLRIRASKLIFGTDIAIEFITFFLS